MNLRGRLLKRKLVGANPGNNLEGLVRRVSASGDNWKVQPFYLFFEAHFIYRELMVNSPESPEASVFPLAFDGVFGTFQV
jgi:hypothetical protein